MNDLAKNSLQKTAALTGATGFIGRYLIEVFQRDGWRLKVLTRRKQNPEPSVEWIAGDIADRTALKKLTEGCDAVIHAAGVTKALNHNAFHEVNTVGVERILAEIGDQASKFLLISSLAAREPRLSDYAATKSAGETILRKQADAIPWIIIRPPAVYGPGDEEVVKLLKVMKSGLALSPGNRGNRFSMIHARDLAESVIALVNAPTANNSIFEVDDGKPAGYHMEEVAGLVGSILNRKIRVLTVPKTLISTLGVINEGISGLTRKPVMLTRGKGRELTHSDWVSRAELKPASTIWQPKIDLRTGLTETIQWCKAKNIL